MNLSFGILLAPYRVDYYNCLHDDYDTEIYFQQKNFDGQLYSTESVTSQCTFEPGYLECRTILSRKVPVGLRNLINKNRPAFVIVPEFSITAFKVILIRAFGRHKFKVISQCDDSYDMVTDHGFSRLHAISRRILMPFIDDLAIPDKRAVEWYQEKYGKGFWCPIIQDEKKHAYLEDSSIMERANELRREYSMDGRLSLLFAGRLIDVKNLPFLIEACTHIDEPYGLFIVGDGERREHLERLAASKGADVHFLGKKNGDELYAWYAASDVFILPSTMEAFGAVTNEALLCGCYSLISKKAGSSCLIEPGVNGDVFDPYSVEDLVKKIRNRKVQASRHNMMTVSFNEAMKGFGGERQKRVFHIITHLDLGGAERVAANIAKNGSGDFEYHVIGVAGGSGEFHDSFCRELADRNVIVHEGPAVSNKLGIVLFPFWFLKLVRRLSPAVIHTHTEVPDLAVFLSWIFGGRLNKDVRFVRTIHNTVLWTGWAGIGCRVEKFFQSKKANVAISESVRQAYADRFGEQTPLIYNGLELSVQEPFPGTDSGKINILFAGRFESQKGVDEMVAVVSHYASDSRFLFHIIGTGTQKQKIVDSLGAQSNAVIYGTVYSIASYLGSFDYLFMPSRHEGLPLLAIESSFAKTPPIINNCAGLNETVPSDWPLMVQDNNLEEYFRIFDDLDKYDREALGVLAYEYVSARFLAEKMNREYECFYKA